MAQNERCVVLPLLQIPDVCVDEQAIHLWVNILNKDLEAIEGAGLWNLHFLTEPLYLSDMEKT